MTAREYLDRPEALRLEIARKRARIDTLRRLATRFSALPDGVRVCSSPDPSRMQGLLAEAADEEQAVRLLEEQRQQALAGAALLISRLPDADAARILELRYLDRLPWEEIVGRMDCSASRVYRLHQEALDLLVPPPDAAD